MRLLLVSGSPRNDSKTRIVMEHAVKHAEAAHPDHEVDFLDLARESPELFRGFEHDYPDRTRALVDRVTEADAYILGSPVYNGSYSAILKNLFEFVNYKALEDRVAGFVLVGGGEMSFLQVRAHLAQLMTYFNVRVVPRGVYAKRDDVEDGPPREIRKRVERLVDKTIALASAYPEQDAPRRPLESRH